MARLVGPQLFHFWYSCRMPGKKTWSGIAVGSGEEVGVGPGSVGSTGIAVGEAIGVGEMMAASVASTIAERVESGEKTTSSGGEINPGRAGAPHARRDRAPTKNAELYGQANANEQ